MAVVVGATDSWQELGPLPCAAAKEMPWNRGCQTHTHRAEGRLRGTYPCVSSCRRGLRSDARQLPPVTVNVAPVGTEPAPAVVSPESKGKSRDGVSSVCRVLAAAAALLCADVSPQSGFQPCPGCWDPPGAASSLLCSLHGGPRAEDHVTVPAAGGISGPRYLQTLNSSGAPLWSETCPASCCPEKGLLCFA